MTLATAVLLPLVLHGAASADPNRERSGATFGASLGAGHLGCTIDGDDCNDDATRPAVGAGLRAGFMLSPALALTGNLWGMVHRDDRLTVSQVLLTAQLRAWLLPTLWVEGGVGLARSRAEVDLDIVQVADESDTVPAIAAGVGLELMHTSTFGLDLQLKGGSGLYDGDVNVYQVSLGVGVNFY